MTLKLHVENDTRHTRYDIVDEGRTSDWYTKRTYVGCVRLEKVSKWVEKPYVSTSGMTFNDPYALELFAAACVNAAMLLKEEQGK